MQKWLSVALVCIPVLFCAWFLYPEIAINQSPVNDMAAHYAESARMSEQTSMDVWFGSVGQGFPLWRVYQPLPHFITGQLMRLFRPWVAPMVVFTFINYVLLCILPVCFFVFARSLGMSHWASGAVAALSIAPACLGDVGRFGAGLTPHLWRSAGLYTQLWGLTVALPTLAVCIHALRTGKRLVLAGVLVATTCLMHAFVGYIVGLTVVLLAVLGLETARLWKQALSRLAVILVTAGLACAWFVIPLWIDGNRTGVWEASRGWMWDSFGAETILGALFDGSLLDYNRLPILSLLVLAGAVIAVLRFRESKIHRTILALAVTWLLLFFGRATWGALMDLLPLSGNLQMHRFEVGFELFAIMLAGLALGELLEFCRAKHLAIAGVVLVAVLFPMYRERSQFIAQSVAWGQENLRWDAKDAKALTPIMAIVSPLANTQTGRVHAGRVGTFGGSFKSGYRPIYSYMATAGVPCTSFLYFGFSLAADTMYLMDEANEDDYRLFGVRYLLAPPELKQPRGLPMARESGRFRLYEVPAAGYFDFVSVEYRGNQRPADYFSTSREWLKSAERAAGQYLVLHSDAPVPYTQPGSGRVLRESKAGETYSAQIEVNQPGYLLLRSSYHPDLHFMVDGRPAASIMVTPGYPAILVQPGMHNVSVRYSPGVLRDALLGLSLVGIGLIWWKTR
jgi:hypothetical protein